jgi:hypothetical protein
VRVEGATEDVVFRVSSLIGKMLVIIETSAVNIDWNWCFAFLPSSFEGYWS